MKIDMEKDINPMPEISLTVADVLRSLGSIAARAFSFLPTNTLATHGDHIPHGAAPMLDNTLFDVKEY